MVLHCALLLVVLTTTLRLSGADGFHLRLEPSRQCLDDCGNNQDCRYKDCRLPIGQEVNITCNLIGECNPLTHPLSIHRIDSEGDRLITNGDVMPGFISLELMTDCSLRMTFNATIEANNIVLQCAIYTQDIKEFSMAHVVAVKEPQSDIDSVVVHPSPSTTLPSISPTTTSSDAGMTSSQSHMTPELSPSTQPDVIDNQPIESCVCMPSEDILTSSGQSVSLCKLLLGTLLTFLMFL